MPAAAEPPEYAVRMSIGNGDPDDNAIVMTVQLEPPAEVETDVDVDADNVKVSNPSFCIV
jgi:hypothetical protein